MLIPIPLAQTGFLRRGFFEETRAENGKHLPLCVTIWDNLIRKVTIS